MYVIQYYKITKRQQNPQITSSFGETHLRQHATFVEMLFFRIFKIFKIIQNECKKINNCELMLKNNNYTKYIYIYIYIVF